MLIGREPPEPPPPFHPARRLFEVSTIDAARSGVAEMVVLTPEQREELTLVETQIKQKLAIGATASKRHLVEDLARLGVNEWAVGKGKGEGGSEGRREGGKSRANPLLSLFVSCF